MIRTEFKLEMSWKAKPRIPSMGSSLKRSERRVTAEKVWLVALTPATVTRKRKERESDKETDIVRTLSNKLTGILEDRARDGGTITILDGEGAALRLGGRRRGRGIGVLS